MNHDPMLGWHEQHCHSVTEATTCPQSRRQSPVTKLRDSYSKEVLPMKGYGELEASLTSIS